MAAVIVLAAAAWWFMQQRFLEIERQSLGHLQDTTLKSIDVVNRVKSIEDRFDQLKSRQGEVETRLTQSAERDDARLAKAEEQVAARLAKAEEASTTRLAKADEQLNSRLAQSDEKVAAVQEQYKQADARQAQIRSFYDDLVAARNNSTLVAAEQGILNASQMLQISGNVRAALVMLDEVQRALDKSDPTDSTGLRKQVLGDMEALKAVPLVDVAALAVKLDKVIDGIGTLPMLAEAASVEAPALDVQGGATALVDDMARSAQEAAPVADANSPEWHRTVQAGWQDVVGRVRDFSTVAARHLSELVTIRKVDDPDVLLLGPQQRHAARDNLRLLLLNARLELLTSQETLFREDLGRAQKVVQTLFDGRSDATQGALKSLAELQKATVAVTFPSLAETLNAARAARKSAEAKN